MISIRWCCIHRLNSHDFAGGPPLDQPAGVADRGGKVSRRIIDMEIRSVGSRGSRALTFTVLLLPRHSKADSVLRVDEVVEAHSVLGNSELNALDDSVEFVPTRAVIR